jgi:hypothetical protein
MTQQKEDDFCCEGDREKKSRVEDTEIANAKPKPDDLLS